MVGPDLYQAMETSSLQMLLAMALSPHYCHALTAQLTKTLDVRTMMMQASAAFQVSLTYLPQH